MKRTVTLVVLAMMLACSAQAAASRGKKHPAASMFTLGDIVLGRTTLEQVAQWLGETSVVESKHPEDERDHLCYKQQVGKETLFLAVSADYPNRSLPVTGFRLTNRYHDWKCVKPNIDLTTLATSNGVTWGMNKTDFAGKFDFAFEGSDTSWVMDRHTHSKAECEGAKATQRRLCTRIFLETLHASFVTNRLVDYEVVRTLAVF